MLGLRYIRRANRNWVRRHHGAHSYGVRRKSSRDHGGWYHSKRDRITRRPGIIKRVVHRIVRIQKSGPHAHLVIAGAYGVFVVRFDGCGRQTAIFKAKSVDCGRAIRNRMNRVLRRKCRGYGS
jgi:hypothetical protein